MRVAFYAPLKAPDHPVASGDREIARLLLRAIAAAGHEVSLASRFRSFDRCGDGARQARLCATGARLAHRLAARLARERRPDLWFTYHLHHKAPDLLGPHVSRVLRIPYVVAEASIAPRQRAGPWAVGYAQALAAIEAADTIVFLNPADVPQIRLARAPAAHAALIAPFVDVAAFRGSPPARRPEGEADARTLRLATVAMMRDGAKLASYRTLARALMRICDLPWRLSIVGDGPAREAVGAAFAPLAERVRFLGVRSADEISALLRQTDLFVWPAVDESIGVVFLEAQASGVPVVGADSAGVAAVVATGRTGLLAPPGDADAFAAATRRLLSDADLRERMASEAPAYVREAHDLPVAAARLDAIIREAVARHRATRGTRVVGAP